MPHVVELRQLPQRAVVYRLSRTRAASGQWRDVYARVATDVPCRLAQPPGISARSTATAEQLTPEPTRSVYFFPDADIRHLDRLVVSGEAVECGLVHRQADGAYRMATITTLWDWRPPS